MATAASPIDAPGEYVHPPSRFVFPRDLATFRRLSLVRRDADTRRITVGYAGGESQCLVAINFWIDPLEQPVDGSQAAALAEMAVRARADEAFEHAKAEVQQAFPAAQLDRMEAGELETMPARRALYTAEDRRVELVTLLSQRAWILKYRIVYPAACAAEASPRINDFFAAWRR